MIITIDGPVATGKSTIAKHLASAIGFIYFDTGAMYRALTYSLIKNDINLADLDGLKKFLECFDFNIKIQRGNRKYFVEKEDITLKIRTEKVTELVSAVSAIKVVREKLVTLQRKMATGVNAVFEGRDMGTVVFPDAYLKIFLVGKPEIRAKRRYDELKRKFPEETMNLTIEKCLEDIQFRDFYDMSREESPLIKAEDAFEIDTSDLTPEEVVFKILEIRDTKKTLH